MNMKADGVIDGVTLKLLPPSFRSHSATTKAFYFVEAQKVVELIK